MPDTTPPKLPGDSSPAPLTPCSEIAMLSAEPVVRGAVPAKRVTRRHHPLPDAVAVRSIAVPQTAPSYDDDQPAVGRTGPDGTAPGQSPPISGSPRSGSPVPANPPSAQRRPPTRDPAGHWPSQFAQVLAETLAGSRPPSQLAPWTTEQARRRIGQLGPMLATAHRPRVKRVIVTSPAGGVLEMAVIVAAGTRVRALAVRLERARPASISGPVSGPLSNALSGPVSGPTNPAGWRGPGSPPDPATGWLCTAIEAA